MKKKILYFALTLALILGLILGLSVSASADNPFGIRDASLEVEIAAYADADGLPYIAKLDIDGDGIMEVIVDNKPEADSLAVTDFQAREDVGNLIHMSKGNCTLYYWNSSAKRVETFPLVNDSMYISYRESTHSIIVSSLSGNEETFTSVSLTGNRVSLESFTVNYRNNQIDSVTVGSDSYDANYAKWYVEKTITNCTPLTFAMYS